MCFVLAVHWPQLVKLHADCNASRLGNTGGAGPLPSGQSISTVEEDVSLFLSGSVQAVCMLPLPVGAAAMCHAMLVAEQSASSGCQMDGLEALFSGLLRSFGVLPSVYARS